MKKKFIFGMMFAILLIVAACSSKTPSSQPTGTSGGSAITGNELGSASDSSNDLNVDSTDTSDAGLTDIQNI